jgi:dephospho-CoA kinase
MRILGITGPSGAGKTYAATELARRGYKKIDVDGLAKTLYLPGRPVYHRILRAFGNRAKGPDGRINTGWLGNLVFDDPRQRARLNAIMFPALMGALRRSLKDMKRQGVRLVVLDMAVLFQAGAQSLVDDVILVEAPEKIRVARLARSRGIPLKRASLQASAWKDAASYRAKAALVLKNTGSRKDFLKSLKCII